MRRSRSRCAKCAASPPKRSRPPSSASPRPSPSASFAPRPASATSNCPTRCRRPPNGRTGSIAVLHTIYLIFNEGYDASSGDALIRRELCDEAIRLARLLKELHSTPDIDGLLALMLLHQSRATTRQTADGDIVLLEDQDRAFWDRDLIAEGTALAQLAFAAPAGRQLHHPGADRRDPRRRARGRATPTGPASSRSTICCCAPSPDRSPNSTAPWPSPCATVRRPGCALIDPLADGPLATYRFAHAAQGRPAAPARPRRTKRATAYARALELTAQAAERRFIEKRLRRTLARPAPASPAARGAAAGARR